MTAESEGGVRGLIISKKSKQDIGKKFSKKGY
jgi:hypothetical protein